METITAAKDFFTIVGRQDDHNGGFRNRYAGVNTRGGACVLTMGELRTFPSRVYFPDYEMARDFFEKFVEKFGHRENTKFSLMKVNGHNPIIGEELTLDDSDCGPFYHAINVTYRDGQKAPWSRYRNIDLNMTDNGVHGVQPTKDGRISWERDANESLSESSITNYKFNCEQSEDHNGDYDLTITNKKTGKSVVHKNVPKAEFDRMSDEEKFNAFIKYNKGLNESRASSLDANDRNKYQAALDIIYENEDERLTPGFVFDAIDTLQELIDTL